MSGDASTPSRLARGVFFFTIRHDAGGWYWGSPNRTGADQATKCYPRVIFGRELLRTGLGGFVTPRVVNFYHQYLAKVFAMVKGEGRVKMDERYKTQQNKKKAWNEELFFFRFDEKGVESSIIGEFDGELKMYHAMGTGSVPLSLHFCDEFVVFPLAGPWGMNSLRRRHDSASLSKIAPGSQMDLNYFTPVVFPAFSGKSLCNYKQRYGTSAVSRNPFGILQGRLQALDTATSYAPSWDERGTPGIYQYLYITIRCHLVFFPQFLWVMSGLGFWTWFVCFFHVEEVQHSPRARWLKWMRTRPKDPWHFRFNLKNPWRRFVTVQVRFTQSAAANKKAFVCWANTTLEHCEFHRVKKLDLANSSFVGLSESFRFPGFASKCQPSLGVMPRFPDSTDSTATWTFRFLGVAWTLRCSDLDVLCLICFMLDSFWIRVLHHLFGCYLLFSLNMFYIHFLLK